MLLSVTPQETDRITNILALEAKLLATSIKIGKSGIQHLQTSKDIW